MKKGVLVGVQPLQDIDAMPTTMLTQGLISRVYSKTRVKYPMVRRSYLACCARRCCRGGCSG